MLQYIVQGPLVGLAKGNHDSGPLSLLPDACHAWSLLEEV